MADDAPTASSRTELRLRVMSGLVMVAAALLTLWFGGWPFAALWIAAGFVAGMEWSRILHPDEPELSHMARGAPAILTGVAAAIGWGEAVPPLVIACILPQFLSATDRRLGALGIVYASAIAVAPILVRAEPGIGLALIAWCFAVVWATDVAAYFTGRALGGPKLWPSVSPKKTWSGAIGGALAGIVAAVIVAWIARRVGGEWPFSLVLTALLALVASAAGQLGDLAESALKRRFGVKDSGSIIPGHGGVLDRLDAFVVVVSLVAVIVALNR